MSELCSVCFTPSLFWELFTIISENKVDYKLRKEIWIYSCANKRGTTTKALNYVEAFITTTFL